MSSAFVYVTKYSLKGLHPSVAQKSGTWLDPAKSLFQALALLCIGLHSFLLTSPLFHWFYHCNGCLILSPAAWELMAEWRGFACQPWQQSPSRNWLPIVEAPPCCHAPNKWYHNKEGKIHFANMFLRFLCCLQLHLQCNQPTVVLSETLPYTGSSVSSMVRVSC